MKSALLSGLKNDAKRQNIKQRSRDSMVYNYDFVYLFLKIESLWFPKEKVAGFNV